MKEFQEFEKTVTEKEVVRVTCDRCGATVTEAKYPSTRELKVSFAKGEICPPDGGYSEGWEVEDLCDSCVVLLQELLQANGFTLKKVEVDW